MSRFLFQTLFVLTLFAFNSHLSLGDDAAADDTSTDAAPAASSAGAEKGTEPATGPVSPLPAEKKESVESTGEEKPADSATDTAPAPKPAESTQSTTGDDEAKETKPAEPKPAAADDSAKEPATTGTETAATEDQLEPWQELYGQWLVVNQKLQDAELKYYHSPKEEQFELRDSFEKLINNEANPLLAKLRAEVIQAYSAKPKDVRLVRLLIGFMVNHARMNEVAEAKEIVELLIENKCDEKYVMVAAKMPGLRPGSVEILEQMEKRYKEARSASDSGASSGSTPDSGSNSSPANENTGGSKEVSSEAKTGTSEPSETNE